MNRTLVDNIVEIIEYVNTIYDTLPNQTLHVINGASVDMDDSNIRTAVYIIYGVRR